MAFLREDRLSGLKTLKSDRSKQIRFLAGDEIQMTLDVADDVTRRAILILLHTGYLRLEFAYLEWKDIGFQNGLINFQSKPEFGFSPVSYKPRFIPMCSQLWKLLMDMPQAGRFVFDSGRNQPLCRPYSYYGDVAKLYKRAEIEGAKMHTFRNTFASYLIMRGVDPRTVQEYLGHSTIQVTEKYSHFSKSHKRDAIEVISSQMTVRKS